MEVSADIITAAVVGATGLLLGNSGTLIRLHSKLSGHIEDEAENQKVLVEVKKRLRRVERKLPNGEVGLMYEMIKALYSEMNGDLGRFELEVKRVDAQALSDEADFKEEIGADGI